ncbi:LysM peptidoglycan-binding domain-containing protein [Pedobacter sp. MR2016-24]|uniref:LysM peptidoglycan-binding domain-containing protein n=1 Tax=Pedobacter sp. MR2016-24 TaxID=2994466 RepID=UPI002245A461|nr:LysM peptidoglycan-binding domain-containing protein [Pedobacter sp. MR2016-24]MCX2484356.1 LysM peptidoglycan-binding domain-containing protein [Pedobacter sp. MR2016-24]
MQKYYILLIFTLFLSLSVKADGSRDSIGVENLNGKKLILHKIVAKDTYYSISRRYNVSPKDIMTFNDNKYLQIGVIVKVPTQEAFTVGTPVKPATTTASNPSPAVASSDGSTIIEHAVQRKENLNMLAEKYGTTINDIKSLNNLKTINLQIGQVLKIAAKKGLTDENNQETSPAPVAAAPVPTPAPVTVPAPSTTPNQYKKPEKQKPQQIPAPTSAPVPVPAATVNKSGAKEEFISHTVASNETMYSIATKYDLTLDQLKAKNNLTTNSLYIGQKLLIKGQYPVKQTPLERDTEDNDADTLESVKNPSLRLPPSRYGLSQLDEKGTGIWIVDQDLDSSKMLVLHRTAPIGTIMKITNPMSNRSTFAKVVGKFTENESTKDVIIVMTKAVADALGALDKRFLCNLTYSGQANEQ